MRKPYLSFSFTLCLLFSIPCQSMDTITDAIEAAFHQLQESIHNFREDFGAMAGAISPELGEFIKGHEFDAIKDNPHKNIHAHVRQGADLCDEEKKFLKNRLPITKAAIEKLILGNLQDKEVPIVSMVNSGGGYRALLWTLGTLRGLEDIGLLDTLTYITALSGSTGTLIPWISSKMTLKEFENYMLNCVTKPFMDMTDEEQILLFEAIAVKKYFNQIRNVVDLYGDALGNRLLPTFKEKRHATYFSQQAEIIQDGSYPCPICIAIDANETKIKNQRRFEYTPYEIASPEDETAIPAWAHGREYKGGKSIKKSYPIYPPAKNISHNLGTFWSAFGANIYLIREELAKKMGDYPVAQIMQQMLSSFDAERPLNFYAEFPNYMYKMKGLKNPESAQEKTTIHVDAGTDCNLPVEPINRPGRQSDLIIICDASAGIIRDELIKVANLYPSLKINPDNVDKKTLSLFYDEHNPATPTVVYMPRISDQSLLEKKLSNLKYKKYETLRKFDMNEATNNGFAQTSNFQYERNNAKQVINLARFNIVANRKNFAAILNLVVKRKQQASQ